MILFLLSTGVSIVFGLMGVVNLAHGMLFMTGAYAGITVSQMTGNFWLGLLVAIVSAGIVGLMIERGFLRTLYQNQLMQMLMCFGFVYIITNLTQWFYGPYPKSNMVLPDLVSGSFPVGRLLFTNYRVAVIILGLVFCAILYWVQERTKIGAVIRAGMDDPEMVYSMGINLMKFNVGAFFLGACLSGFAGFIGIPIFGGLTPVIGQNMIFTAIAVCIIGGVGSIEGALIGAILIGLGTSIAQTFYPELAMFITYILMILILTFRTGGIVSKG
jgi:branched-chain amino acid transport system permease protein